MRSASWTADVGAFRSTSFTRGRRKLLTAAGAVGNSQARKLLASRICEQLMLPWGAAIVCPVPGLRRPVQSRSLRGALARAQTVHTQRNRGDQTWKRGLGLLGVMRFGWDGW